MALAATVAHPTLVYRGRTEASSRLMEAEGVVVMDDIGATPYTLRTAMESAGELVILDPVSFPYESLEDSHWDVPISVAMPELPRDVLEPLIGPVLLDRLTFYDQVMATADQWAWLKGYRLSSCQWIPADRAHPGDMVERIVRYRTAWDELDHLTSGPEKLTFWGVRSVAAKRAHRRVAAALDRAIRDAASQRPGGMAMHLMVIGAGPGRWMSLAESITPRVTYYESSTAMIRQARLDRPASRVRRLTPQLRVDADLESVDAIVLAFELSARPLGQRVRLMRECWSKLRIGGSLIILDDLGGRGGESYTTGELELEAIEATGGSATIEDVWALSIGFDEPSTTALVRLTRLGPSERL